jgi:hypothetical protein
VKPNPNTHICKVEEGPTGILRLTASSSPPETYLPNCDMDAAIELLKEFQLLRDADTGTLLKDNYHCEGFDWYPTMVSQLFWYVFLPWVKYHPLALDSIQGRKKFVFDGPGNFRGLILALGSASGRSPRVSWKLHLHEWMWKLNNELLVRRKKCDVVFFRFAEKDFRSREILTSLANLGVSYIPAVPSHSIWTAAANIIKRGSNYYFAQPPPTWHGNRFKMSYNLKGLTVDKRALFSAAVLLVERTITTCVADMQLHRRWLGRSGAQVFYGFDDVNTYLFPLLYAARSLGIFTLGHQHGAYVKRHAGYTLPGLPDRSFVWFDRVLVWGPYWRDKMIREAPVHPPEIWALGSNKLQHSFTPRKANVCGSPPSNILIPYEFLTDTATVGRFIRRFVECGYTVWFRPRPDETIASQLDAYLLPEAVRGKLHLAQGPMNDDLLSKIDIVAGTMTTMIYELLPAGKIVWYLDTPYRHLLDLAEEGVSHNIRLEDIRPPGQMPAATTRPTAVEAKDYFGTKTLHDTLQQHLCGPLAAQEARPTI